MTHGKICNTAIQQDICALNLEGPRHAAGAFAMTWGWTMRPVLLTALPEDLVFAHEASAATGVPEGIIRLWATRKKIQRFDGDGRPSGQGHLYRTMYSLPEVRDRARLYRPRGHAAAA